jgi:hypothetical protein
MIGLVISLWYCLTALNFSNCECLIYEYVKWFVYFELGLVV